MRVRRAPSALRALGPLLMIALLNFPLLPAPAAGAAEALSPLPPTQGVATAGSRGRGERTFPSPDLPSSATPQWWAAAQEQIQRDMPAGDAGTTGLSPTPAWTASGENNDDFFGYSVATAGTSTATAMPTSSSEPPRPPTARPASSSAPPRAPLPPRTGSLPARTPMTISGPPWPRRGT